MREATRSKASRAPSERRQQQTPTGAYALMALLLLLSVGALFGGGALIIDPSGELLEMPVTLLAGTPFPDYLIPGIVLFTLFGVIALLTVVGLWFRPAWQRSSRLGVDAAWLAAIATGAALIIWILVQMTILRFFLQPILLVQGLAIIIVSLLPRVRNHYRAPAPQASRNSPASGA